MYKFWHMEDVFSYGCTVYEHVCSCLVKSVRYEVLLKVLYRTCPFQVTSYLVFPLLLAAAAAFLKMPL